MAALEVRHPEKLAFVTQTTLSIDDTAKVIDALRAKFPNIQGPRKDDICYATQNRQDAVRDLAENVMLCWLLAHLTRQIRIVYVSLLSVWGKLLI